MRIAAENSEEEVNRLRAQEAITWPLKELAANVMRVTRGAGKPYMIGAQCVEVISAFEEYREVVGIYPSSEEIQSALEFGDRYRGEVTDDHTYAVSGIVEGGLQVAASTLLHQLTQVSAGESQLYDGVNALEQAREASRRAMRKPVSPRARPVSKDEL